MVLPVLELDVKPSKDSVEKHDTDQVEDGPWMLGIHQTRRIKRKYEPRDGSE